MRPHLLVGLAALLGCASSERASQAPTTSPIARVEKTEPPRPASDDPRKDAATPAAAEPASPARTAKSDAVGPAPAAPSAQGAPARSDPPPAPAPPQTPKAADPKPAPPAPAKAVPVQTTPGPLVRGTGPAPNPAPEPVAGHAMLPVWDDATGPRPRAVSLVWGTSEACLNLYDPPRATPMQVEFSLDGGPWLAARYGRVVVPDLGVGTYQIRCVAFPAQGKSWVMKPVVLERTADGWRLK